MLQLIRLSRALCLGTALVACGWFGSAQADDSDAASHNADAPARIAVGHEAPEISLASSTGDTHTLSELRGEKNLLVIFFRGTW